MVKIQITDVNDNHPIFYPSEYNVSLGENGSSSSTTIPVVIVAATDSDSGKFGTITYKIVSGNDAGVFRIEKSTGEIFINRPTLLSARGQPYHRLNISAVDGGNLKSLKDAEVYISVIDSTQRPPIFEHPRYIYTVSENVWKNTVIGTVKATVFNNVGRSNVRYSIYSGDPDGLFSIDSLTGVIATASNLDHETKSSVLLNVQATSGEPPVYGHTQVNIEIEDVNDNAPEFDSSIVRISVPENVEIGSPLYSAHAKDKDSGSNGIVNYKIINNPYSGLFKVDTKNGDLTITRRLDYETSQRHSLVITATDNGAPSLSSNLTVLVEVQDVNDNAPVFERNEYSLSILESLAINTQILQLTAIDADSGNNARITYRLITSNSSHDTDNQEIFGIFPNNGWIYLRAPLDRETKDKYVLTVAATDNGTPSETTTTKVLLEILDANDNDPVFGNDSYEFSIEENLGRGTLVGKVSATDADIGQNAAIRYSLIPSNSSFQINQISGEITTKESLDREQKQSHDIVVEARDQGVPSRSIRKTIVVTVLDVNDNAPEIVDPQEDVISVREEQPIGTEVVRIRAVDLDNGLNASITYSVVKNRDYDGHNVFSIDPVTGIIKTRAVLDHEEKTIYRLGIAATDGGQPPKETVRILRIEVLDLNDNRPTFTSSSLVFRVKEDAPIGYVVGSISVSEPTHENSLNGAGGYVTYTLTSLSTDVLNDAFDIDRSTGTLVVSRQLDRETQSEYKLEVRALDTSAMNNPQSSAVTVRIDVADVNDNPPKWSQDPITIQLNENTDIGTAIYNFTASDHDTGTNSDLRYGLTEQFPRDGSFSIDSLTGTLILTSKLDFETTQEYTLIVSATDQSYNVSERLTASVTAKISILDTNDNPPVFVTPLTVVYIPDTTIIGMTITHIVAIDKDSGDNGKVSYVITNGNEEGIFSLGYDTGCLTLAKPLSGDRKNFVLNITANDRGSPTRKATVELKLMVRGSVDSVPKFLEAQYMIEVSEDVAVGSVVTKMSAKSGFVTEGHNLTFVLPSDETFDIISSTGEVIIKKPLDREKIETYIATIYVSESSHKTTLFDTTTLVVKVTDVNDNFPKFQPGSCYKLSVPENSDTAVIHTIVAEDEDEGANGEIYYSITGGNIGNKFSIDVKSGEISSRPLDRESQWRYSLTIVARDRGNPSLQSDCNLTIFVEDQNDNDPKFDLSKYSVAISEDTPIDTSVLKVHASDADQGINARIIYSLANESHWLFRVDNKTGVITTVGSFDREKQSTYSFHIVATDSGKYNARSQSVQVTVKILDVNDNKPIFTQYPFKQKVLPYIQPGQIILKVTANDADEGTNADIVYSLSRGDSYGKFRIHPNTGVLTTTQSLASNKGKVIYLNVQATDKGNPSRSSSGLVEITVGDLQDGSPELKFQNDTYTIRVAENAEQFTDIVQVSAIRTDGRRQKILYNIGSGNEDNIFVINSDSGIIQVRDSKNLDYELHKTIELTIEAKTEGSPSLRGYCKVAIRLTDENDNAPRFTQQRYAASVWEGNKKGEFVLQVIASEPDEGANSRILYHIVDGNHDNAFKIEPAFSGILKTNIVLDREIRDLYRLTVIATDEGVPQMTGTARIRIDVVDINDNQPTFPPHSIITVKEDTSVGTVLTIVKANDVDTYPPLIYNFAKDNFKNDLQYFSIDRYSGKVVLMKNLDFELWRECKIGIVASDTAHSARTTLTVKVDDVNDNAPVFLQSSYVASLPDGNSSPLSDILALNASDADSGDNAKIIYSLVDPLPGFSIDAEDGILRANISTLSHLNEDILLTVKATDSGTPPLHTLVSVKVKTNGGVATGTKSSNKMDYKVNIPENTTIGSSIIHLTKPTDALFKIVEGNEEGIFEVINPSGDVVLIKPLDRERQDFYNLKISNDISSTSMINLKIELEDSNDNPPIFQIIDHEKTISENLPIGSTIETISATDADLINTPNSDVYYEITSGNDEGNFQIHRRTGILTVNKTLDFDKGNTRYNIVIRACDRGVPILCTLNTFTINLRDENDNEPKFPVTEYLEFVKENEPVGTAVFTARATDADKGPFGQLTYSIIPSYGQLDNSWKLFNVDKITGLVTTSTVFDYEQRNKYNFMIQARDTGGKSTSIKTRIEIEGKDEFHPQFTERTYKLTLATSSILPIGYIAGRVTATDRDKGPDGRIVYQLATQHPYFKVNRTTGDIMIKKKLDYAELPNTGGEISLIITATSGRQGSLTNTTVVEIILDPLADPGTNLAINGDINTSIPSTGGGGIADWVMGLLIALILLVITFGAVFVYLHMRNKRNKKINKPTLGNEAVSSSNNYVDPSAFDTIPIRSRVGSLRNGNNQFAPPKYDEIPPYGAPHPASSNSGAATTSELSGSERSGSSGRGSAEDDGEDEEIRMINEGPLPRDQGALQDGDALSNNSVRNTQEYLARLGIINNNVSNSNSNNKTVPPMDIFDEEVGTENDITNLIYAKLNDVTGGGNSDRVSSTNDGGMMNGYGDVAAVTHQPSMNGSLSSIVHSEEELAGSYNWDYLLVWEPQYQPLAHIFSEIARLKDDTASVHSGASATSSVKSKNSVAHAKSVPPPLITSIAPRSIAMPVLNSRSAVHHNQMMLLPRSPISHDLAGATSTAMSPSFSPSLSPLATKSPSVSPLVAPGLPASHHVMARQTASRNKSVVDAELRI
ncbi:protein dachsous [Diorhabda sublineata]|uniref:protein dachsous n=1 Tax=Diorhabda sublineata TaxID=1163346 RepID=UPI0024E07A7B|nr:protein dachsous [Diorhabda sublineata]